MRFTFTVLLLLQAAILFISFQAAVVARLRHWQAERAFRCLKEAPARVHARRAAVAATRLIINMPASRRVPIPRAAPLEHHVGGMTAVLRRNVEVVGRDETHSRRLDALLGSLLLLDYDSPACPLNDVFSAIFNGNAIVATHAAWAVGRNPAAFTSGAVAVTSAVRGGPRPVSRTALWSLAQLLGQHPEQLLMMTHEPDVSLRALIVRTAGEVGAQMARARGDGAAVPYRAVCRAALSDPSETVRATAAHALRHSADAPSLESLSAALRDRSTSVQCAAAESLAATRNPWALMAIANNLIKAPLPVRHASLRAVAHHRPEPPATLLLWLQERGDARVLAALELLSAARPSQQVLDAIFPLCVSSELDAVRAAARALACLSRASPGLLRLSPNLDRLIAGLKSEDDESVGSFIEALAMTGDERVIAPLLARIPLSGRYIREKVVEGLALLEVRKELSQRPAVAPSPNQETIILTR